MLQEGDILKDRYKVQQLIGKGGMSRVFMGTDMKLQNKLWAIKEVSRNATDQAGRPIEQSLAIEAELLSKLDHPMIVDIVDIVTTDECIYVVMDYVEGKSLDKVIREEGPQKEEDIQDWALQICDALDYLHSQDPPIIYRDMKPSNIMLRPDGYIKLIDLGVAREYKDKSTKDTVSFGTEGYAPPEQYGKAQTDARSDIYALGATMWHLLAGESPSEYPLPDVRSKNESVGEGFAQVIVPKCTQLDRDLRYQNCNELIADLEVYEELTQEYFDKQKKKVTKFLSAAGSGVAMLLISLIFFIAGNILVAQNYNYQMTLAATSSDLEVCEKAYKDAIGYMPGELEPYKKLMIFYEEKTGNGSKNLPIFTNDKYNEIHSLIDSNKDALIASGQYAELYYEVGKALWDNYDDGSSSSDVLMRDSAINKAKDYFIVARDNSRDPNIVSNSEMYINIAEFNEQITKFKDDNDRVSKDEADIIEDYISSLEELCENAENNSSNKVKLNAYAIIQSAFNNNANDFFNVNISKNRLENLATKVRNGLNSLNFESAIFKQAKEKCINSFNIAMSRIERAYSNTSVGNK